MKLAPALYPVAGIFYFLSHPYLFPLLRSRLVPCSILYVIVALNLFIWAYLPQVAFLAIFHGRAGAWINGTVLVLGEATAVVAVLFEAFFVDETQVDLFDAVLVARGHAALVQISRPVDTSTDGLSPYRRLGKPRRSAVFAPFSCRQIFEFLFLLPLNLIPWVGVPLFLLLTGYRAGPLLHWRYYKLRGFKRDERKEHVKRYRQGYTLFGIVALLLQLVPVFSLLFLLTTAAGSALMAARMEDIRALQEADAEDRPPEYVDDPV